MSNWLEFSAAKKNAEDDTIKDFYSDSSGKSGGEREKLAYTILASALAFQFGLEWNQLKSRSFRFAVMTKHLDAVLMKALDMALNSSRGSTCNCS